MADPQSRLVVITIFTYVVRPSPLFKIHKTEQSSSDNSGGTVSLAEWIIDDTCFVLRCSVFLFLS